MISWRQLVPVLALLFTTRSSQAQGNDAQARAARKACLAGDFAKGVAILSELYVSTGDPTFIFNQGRCFEQNDCEGLLAKQGSSPTAPPAAVAGGGSKESREKAAMRACLTGDAAAGVGIPS